MEPELNLSKDHPSLRGDNKKVVFEDLVKVSQVFDKDWEKMREEEEEKKFDNYDKYIEKKRALKKEEDRISLCFLNTEILEKESVLKFLEIIKKNEIKIIPIYKTVKWFLNCPFLGENEKVKKSYFPKKNLDINLEFFINLKKFLKNIFKNEDICIKLNIDKLIYTKIAKFPPNYVIMIIEKLDPKSKESKIRKTSKIKRKK